MNFFSSLWRSYFIPTLVFSSNMRRILYSLPMMPYTFNNNSHTTQDNANTEKHISYCRTLSPTRIKIISDNIQ